MGCGGSSESASTPRRCQVAPPQRPADAARRGAPGKSPRQCQVAPPQRPADAARPGAPGKFLGQGCFKICYQGKIVGKHGQWHGMDIGADIVIKVVQIAAYKKGARLNQKDLQMQGYAGRLVNTFNQKRMVCRGGNEVRCFFRQGFFEKSPCDYWTKGGKSIAIKGEEMQVELAIEGHYEKFNSPSGWTSGRKVPDFLSHWSWVHTDGDVLLCDLQGHRGRPEGPRDWHGCTNYYLFTDPAMHSRDKRYGSTDGGQAGMRHWFSHHTCNELCKQNKIHNRRPHAFQRVGGVRASLDWA